MPDTDAALMTAFLHLANPMRAGNVIDIAMPFLLDILRPSS